MGVYTVGLTRDLKKVFIAAEGETLPEGAVNIGEFEHGEEGDEDGLQSLESHVIYHHVKELLYHTSERDPEVREMFPDNITSTQYMQILLVRDLPTEEEPEPEPEPESESEPDPEP